MSLRIEKIDLQALRHQRQYVPEQKLATVLQQFGFVQTSTHSGSHRHYKNPEFGVVCVLVEVHGANDPFQTNRSVAEACLQIKTKREEARLAAVKPPVIIAASNGNGLIDTRNSAPDFIEAMDVENHTDVIVLRLKEARYIGSCAPAKTHKAGLEALITGLLETKKRFDNEVAVAAEIYEIEIGQHEQFGDVLVHNGYCNGVILEPYTPSSIDPFKSMETIIAITSTNDKSAANLLQHFTRVAKQNPQPDGSVEYESGYTHPISSERKTKTLKTSPQKRVSFLEVFGFLDEEFQFICGQAGKTDYIAELLKANGGYVLRNKQQGLAITHPYYPDLHIPYPQTSQAALLKPVFEKAVQAGNFDLMVEPINTRKEILGPAYEAMQELARWNNATLAADTQKTNEMRNKLRAAGFKETGDKKLVTIGRSGELSYTNGSKTIKVPCMHIRKCAQGSVYLIEPASMPKLEQALKNVTPVNWIDAAMAATPTWRGPGGFSGLDLIPKFQI